jgi:hypothetical protein
VQVYVLFTELLACLVKDSVFKADLVKEGSSRGKQRSTLRNRLAGMIQGKLRRSKTWEEVLPPPESKVGKRWIQKLHDQSVHLPQPLKRHVQDEGEPPEPPEHALRHHESAAHGLAHTTLAGVWLRRMEERSHARAAFKVARKRLRTLWADASCQTSPMTSPLTSPLTSPRARSARSEHPPAPSKGGATVMC